MKTRSAVAIAGLAVALGAATGVVLLPHDSEHAHDPASGPASGPGSESASASASGSPAPAALGTGSLLNAKDVAANGYGGEVAPKLGKGEGGLALSACTGEERLSDIVPEGASMVHGTLLGDGGDVAHELAVEAANATQSVRLASRVFEELTACQQEPAGHWRYGQDQQVKVSKDVSADWMSVFNGNENGAGTGPACGGIAVAVNGARLAVIEVDWCTTGPHVAGIARAAAIRLGA